MRVFVTGSTGYIGNAVVRGLVAAGHQVGGLYHRSWKEKHVREAGAVPIFGNLKDPETYQHFAAECDAVVHAGFEKPDIDEAAVEELLGALAAEGEQKTFVYTSSCSVLGNTGPHAVDESASTDGAPAAGAWRALVEQRVLSAAGSGLVTAVVRPGYVYGGTRGGWLATYAGSALREGAATFVGDGSNHVPPIYIDDLAGLYLAILEKRVGGVFHGVDESSPTIAEMARAYSLAAGKGGAVRSTPVDDARRKSGAVTDLLVLDQRVLSRRSSLVGWKRKRKGFLEEVGAAFAEWTH